MACRRSPFLAYRITDRAGNALSAEGNLGGQRRTTTLRVSVEGGTEETQATLEVRQGNGAMILSYDTEKPDAVVTLPTEGVVKCTINWGMGKKRKWMP